MSSIVTKFGITLERRGQKMSFFFVPSWHHPRGIGLLCQSGSVQSLKLVRKVKKKEEWAKAFNV